MKNSTHADLGPYSCDRKIALNQKVLIANSVLQLNKTSALLSH